MGTSANERCEVCARVSRLVTYAGMRVCGGNTSCWAVARSVPASKMPAACRWCADELVPALALIACGRRREWECIDNDACGRRTRRRYGVPVDVQLRLF